MRILVIGAAGYIGSRLVTDLSVQGHEIVAGVHSPAGERALRMVFKGDILAGDICDENYRLCLIQQNCDSLLYLASLDYQRLGRDSSALRGLKVEPLRDLLERGLARSLKRAIFLSTQQVYGNFGASTDEESLPKPVSSYGVAHRLGEEVAEHFHRSSPLVACSLRLANVVGAPGCRRDEFLRFAVTDMCNQALRDRRIALRSGWGVTRDFVSMSDVVAAVQLLLRLPKEKLFDGVFNIGSGETCDIADVAQRVAQRASQLSGSDVKIEIPVTSAANAAQANTPVRLRDLGFQSTMSLDEAIAETFKYLQRS